ncbi:MAG: RluA family pseudouridine synthase [Planctomyces sp.]|nr:RluA family pseudouridine synthase [Planctomyces sp.]
MPAQRPPSDPGDTHATSPLLDASGRVDKAALFRAASADAHAQPTADQPRRIAPSPDDEILTDDPDAPPDPSDDDEPSALPDPAALAPVPVRFRLARDLDKRLDKYLCDRVTFMSRAQLQRLIDAGHVSVNNRVAKPSTRLRRGDLVRVLIPPPPSPDTPAQDIPIDVLFEDEHLIVLNKSPDIIVHPARSELSGTLINALAYHFAHRSPRGGALSEVGKQFARPGVVHRLDRQTSGVIAFAKSDQAHWHLARQFELRTVEKRYLALVHGRPLAPVEVIDEPIGPHPSREKGYRERHVVRHDQLGKPALSIARTLCSHDAGPDLGPVSVVEVEIKTGRTHQIRVHLQHRGCPLLGDDMYGGKHVAAMPQIGRPALRRVALHAAHLAFRHPITHAPMVFTPELHGDMLALRRFLSSRPAPSP